MHSALRQKKTLQAFHNRLYEKSKGESTYPASNWETIAKITDLLTIFKNATIYTSGVYYPISSLALNQVYLLATKLADFEFESQVF